MSLTADALQPLLVSGMMSLSGRTATTRLSDVIIDAPRAGYDLDFDTADSAIRIDFRETSFLASAIAADAARFASACFTSLNSVPEGLEERGQLAWCLVKLYYSAFYGGHAVLRMLGKSCSQLENRHVNKIKELGDALQTPAPFKFGAGLYYCALNSNETGISLKQAGGGSGGSHEVFWDIFDEFLSEATEDVLVGRLGPQDAVLVFAKLESLRRIYGRGTGASWLSRIRNEVQYRQLHGVWEPPSINKTNRAKLARLAAQWRRDPMEIDIEIPPGGDLGAFIAACAFTAALCRALLERVAERSSVGGQSFAKYPLQLC